MLRCVTLQGKTIWALGFFSVLSGLNAIVAIVLAIELGIEGQFEPYLIGSLTGGIPTYVYLIVSIIATLIFLGGTSSKIVSELSNKSLLNEINAKVSNLETGQRIQQEVLESLQARVFLVDESLNGMRKEVTREFGKQEEELKRAQTNIVRKFDSELTAIKSEMVKQLNGQREEIKKTNANFVNSFTKNLVDVKNELATLLAGMSDSMSKHEQRNIKSEKAILKQQNEITEVKTKLERLETEFIKPKPQLASQNRVEEVRGIGETTGKDLRAMGITTVGELVLTDSDMISVRTGMSEKMVEKLQGRAQLAMVPGIQEKDLILLEEAGVTNWKELSSQESLELGRKINSIFNRYVAEGKMTEAEKPSIEEIDSWVKFAKT
jgi:predicted flap endonuclease-1-like 5' DNA nuclease